MKPNNYEIIDITKLVNYEKNAEPFEKMKESYHEGLNIQIFDTKIPPEQISPNKLHRRFQASVLLLKTELYDRIKNIIDVKLESNQEEIILMGPMGIGKSHALLAEVLRLRKENKIVIYINNTDAWIDEPNHFIYFINELIYGAIPLSDLIETPIEIDLPNEPDNLLKWYLLLMYFVKTGDAALVKGIKRFITEIKQRASQHKKTIFVVCDQENCLMREDIEGKKYTKKFPFYLRNQIGNRRIISMSANNEPELNSPELKANVVFARMTSISKIFLTN